MTKYFQVKQIKPNPFRRIDKYPMRAEKISALSESIDSTTFWENIVGRELPDGTCEIAYGHHRLRVLQMKYKPTDKVGIIIRELSDTDMLQIMARENMEEWGSSALVEVETIAATVQAYAEGKIKLERPEGPKSEFRYAPNYSSDNLRRSSDESPYNAVSIGKFLGWLKPSGQPQSKIKTALNALALIEIGELKENDLTGLKTTELEDVIEETNRRIRLEEFKAKQKEDAAARWEKKAKQASSEEKREEAKQFVETNRAEAAQHREAGRKASGKVARTLTQKLREGSISRKQIKGEAFKIAPVANHAPPDINAAVRKFTNVINSILNRSRGDSIIEKLDQLLEFNSYISKDVRSILIRELTMLKTRIDKIIDSLNEEVKTAKQPTPNLLKR